MKKVTDLKFFGEMPVGVLHFLRIFENVWGLFGFVGGQKEVPKLEILEKMEFFGNKNLRKFSAIWKNFWKHFGVVPIEG